MGSSAKLGRKTAEVKALFRDYDSALCRAATEHCSKEQLKEKVNLTARIAACRGYGGQHADSFVRRIVEVSEDPMAIKENLLFITDSIMRHAERDDPRTAKSFEKAFEPVLRRLFKTALRRNETQQAVGEYLLRKLMPTWKANCWFPREMPRIMRLLTGGRRARRKEPVQEVALSPAAAAELSELEPTETVGAPWEPAYDPFMERSPCSPLEEELLEPPPDVPSLPVPTELGDQDLEPTEEDAPEARPVSALESAAAVAAVEPSLLPQLARGEKGPHAASLDQMPSSPTEIPVPTEQPAVSSPLEGQDLAPTSPVNDEDALPAPTSPAPSSPADIADASMLPVAPPKLPAAKAALVVSPTELPVPTEVPAPTSPASDVAMGLDEDELRPPTTPVPSPDMLDVEPPILSRAAAGKSAGVLPSPTELPAPTSPVPSPVQEDMEMQREVPVAVAKAKAAQAPPSSPTEMPAPTSPVPSEVQQELAAAELEVPVPRQVAGTRMAPVPSSPTEVPAPTSPAPSSPWDAPDTGMERVPAVPPMRATGRQLLAAPSSPTEIPVPTEVPEASPFGQEADLAPTSPAPEDNNMPAFLSNAPSEIRGSTFEAEFQLPQASSQPRVYGRSEATFSPTELPAPTSPVPSLVAADDESIVLEDHMQVPPPPLRAAPGAAADSLTPREEAVESSPTDMPVPTAVPSPTSPHFAEEMTVPVPVPTSGTAVVTTSGSTGTIVPTVVPTLQAPRPLSSSQHMATSSPTEMPVPTAVPSPTSPGMEMVREPVSMVPQLPAALSAHYSAPESAPVMESAPSSPTEMPVPTDVPSPTSPAPAHSMYDIMAAVNPPGFGAPSSVVEVAIGASEAPELSSPTEMPVPTVVPSPTSPGPAQPGMGTTMELPAFIAADSETGLPASVVSARNMEVSAPVTSSPTEMPVPTAVPSPTSPAPEHEGMEVDLRVLPPDMLSAPPAVMSGVPMSADAPGSAVVGPSSPTEMPVPTAVPSPTSPCAEEVGPEISVAEMPLSVVDTEVERLIQAVPAEDFMEPVAPVSGPHSGPRASATGLPDTSSPTDMPVPTDVPSPTSPAAADEEGEIAVPSLHPPSGEPRSEEPRDDVDVVPQPAAVFSAAMDSAEMGGSVPEPSSPTEMPVPTDVPSPTSPAAATDVADDMAPDAFAPPPDLQSFAGVDAGDLPDDYLQVPRPSTRMDSALDLADLASVPEPSSPTEMPVPTDVPSPTSPARTETVEDIVPHMPPAGFRAESAPMSADGESAEEYDIHAIPSSPTDMPVPTDVPSPTSPALGEVAEVPVPTMVPSISITATATPPTVPTAVPPDTVIPDLHMEERESDEVPTVIPPAIRGGLQYIPVDVEAVSLHAESSSPTEMPVPTAVPSTTPASRGDDDGGSSVRHERIVRRPLPVPRTGGVQSPTSPAIGYAGSDEVPMEVPTEVPSARLIAERRMERPVQQRGISSPTELPVPTDVPSPMSLAHHAADAGDEDALPQAVLSIPTGSVAVISSTTAAEVPVLPDMLSPTSPANIDDAEDVNIQVPRVLPLGGVLIESEDIVPVPIMPMVSTMSVPSPTTAIELMAAESVHGAPSSALPPSPTEMPVPTDVPSPTSPGAGAGDVDVVAVPVGLTLDVPEGALAHQHSATMESAEMGVSVPAPSSPTEMPVPTDIPSPTSPAPADAEPLELPAAPARLEPLERSLTGLERPEDEDLDEVLVPVERQGGAAGKAASSVPTAAVPILSPTELPVPTDVPSPTSPVGADEQISGFAPTQPARRGRDRPPVMPLPPADPTSPASPLAEDQRLDGPPAQTSSGGTTFATLFTELPTATVTATNMSLSAISATNLSVSVTDLGGSAEHLPTEVPSSEPPPTQLPAELVLEMRAREEEEIPVPTMTLPTELPPSVEPPVPTEVPTMPLIPAAPASPPVEYPSPVADEEVAAQRPTKKRKTQRKKGEASAEAGPSTPELAAAGLPRQPTTPTHRGWGAPPTPKQVTARQPGTPEYSPTEDALAPTTPRERRGFSSAGRATSAEREGSSPTYIAEDRLEEPLPPTPTYSGSSPTYLDDNEPPTPTLEADDYDVFGDDASSVAASFISANVGALAQRLPALARRSLGHPSTGAFSAISAPGSPTIVLQPGTPAENVAVGTPPYAPGTPEAAMSIRLPGLESPTPTFEDDDEALYGGFGASEPPKGPVVAAPRPKTAGPSTPPPGMPQLASEVFPAQAGRRRQRGTGSSDEELPPWKRRERRRKPQ